MATFHGVEPADVDNGELDGLSPAESFTLGVEWQMVRQQADGPGGFERPVHARNQDRVRAALDRRGRRHVLTHMPEDRSESWMWLVVEPAEDSE